MMYNIKHKRVRLWKKDKNYRTTIVYGWVASSFLEGKTLDEIQQLPIIFPSDKAKEIWHIDTIDTLEVDQYMLKFLEDSWTI